MYNCIIVHPKASFADLICRTHQYYHRQRLWNTEWSNSRRSAWARDRWIWRERLWGKEGFKMRVENATRNVNNRSRIRACYLWNKWL